MSMNPIVTVLASLLGTCASLRLPTRTAFVVGVECNTESTFKALKKFMLPLGFATVSLVLQTLLSAQDSAVVPTSSRIDAQPEAITNSIGMKLVPISAGRFSMGSPASERGSLEDEVLHKVELTQSFHMGATEVTEHQWAMVMEEPFRTELVEVRDPDTRRLIKKEERQIKNPKLDSQLPITNIAWSQAVEFCKKLGQLPEEKKEVRKYRLPTEAEWEYACRAGTSTAFSFGSVATSIDDYAWYQDNCQELKPVAGKKPNAWGLYDMHGNVSEWCYDFYGDYPESLVSDPIGPDTAQKLLHVIRSGSIQSRAIEVRSASRDKSVEKGRLIGFRLLLESKRESLDDTTNSIGQRLIKIDAGTFEMGSANGILEKPVHTVDLTNDFLISQTEVTQGQWMLVMETEPWKRYDVPTGKEYAACGISWLDAQEFCRRLSAREEERRGARNYRLPTEAEWEYACRAGTKSDFYFGKNSPETNDAFAWFSDSKMTKPGPQKVMQKKPNAWDLYDMHGNVAEWCSDIYGGYSPDEIRNPRGPSEGEYRVFRGGSWSNKATSGRSADRYRALPTEQNERQGFRVVVN